MVDAGLQWLILIIAPLPGRTTQLYESRRAKRTIMVDSDKPTNMVIQPSLAIINQAIAIVY